MSKVRNGEAGIAEKAEGSKYEIEWVAGATARNANDAQGLAHSFIVLHGSPDFLTQPDWSSAVSIAADCVKAASGDAAGQAGRACPTIGSIATASAASRLMKRRHIIATYRVRACL
jgi:hypothetical protein